MYYTVSQLGIIGKYQLIAKKITNVMMKKIILIERHRKNNYKVEIIKKKL
jgi:hypothetical protein